MKPPKIRKPLLADLLLATGTKKYLMDTRWTERSLDRLRLAKKFVLDDKAAEYVALMVKENPRIVADAQDFAVPPFKLMWVEFPFATYFRTVSDTEPDATSDRRLGYLVSGSTVVVGAESSTGCSWLPVEYQLHKPMTASEEHHLMETLKTSRLGIDVWFWGQTARFFMDDTPTVKELALEDRAAALDRINQWGAAGLRALRANNTVQLAPIKAPYDKTVYPMLLEGSAGDLRNIVAMLLFLNRTADVQYQEETPMGQAIVHRAVRPLMPYTTISMKLDPMPRLRKLVAGSGVMRRLHDVRGHFCHDKRAREGCLHGEELQGDWGEWWEEYDVLRWKCVRCGGKRWWRKEHHRGSSDVGVIKEQIYAVTK